MSQVVEYARKALVTGAMMLLAQRPALQLIVGVLVLVAFLAVLVRLAPYKHDADDVLAIVCQMVVLLALLLGLWLTSLVNGWKRTRARDSCAPACSHPANCSITHVCDRG